MKRLVVLFVTVAALGAACSSEKGDTATSATTTTQSSASSGLTLNELQMIGTHNSYHVAPEAKLFAAEKQAVAAFGEQAKALGDINSLEYTHRPLATQLDSGIRSFELDVWADPVGGLFAHPLAPTLLNIKDTPLPTGMDQPGFKVLHITDIDFISTCPTFVSCLDAIRTWSDAHPNHVPIVINVELEDDPLPAPLDTTKVVKIGGPQMDALDAEIRSVFPEKQLLTPDDVRGDAPTLRDAVTKQGWPKVDDVRGKVMFYMDNGGQYRDDYLAGHPSLKGRVLFTSAAAEGDDDEAVVKINDPKESARITKLVKEGFFIRTRADADLVEQQANDTTNRTITFDSGAQVVSTDFPVGETASNGYDVTFGTGLQVRCNAVLVSKCPKGPLEP